MISGFGIQNLHLKMEGIDDFHLQKIISFKNIRLQWQHINSHGLLA
jgi:hypothetical protein